MKKILLVILDGLGDRPIKKLENKTPLEASEKENLNWLCKEGKIGLMYPIRKDIAPESDEAALSLLGYNPFEVYTGRGPLEALGWGIDFNKGDIVLRCNFTKSKDNYITDFEFKPTEEDVKKYVDKINKIKIEGIDLRFVKTLGYRAVLILKDNLSDKISNTHPGYEVVENYVSSALPRRTKKKIKECKPLDNKEESKKTAKIINEFVKRSEEVLEDNLKVVTRGAGSSLPKIEKKYKDWILMGDTPVEKAVGELSGMEVLEKPKDLDELAEKIKKSLKEKKGVYLQIKGPDSWGHENKPIKKKESIEQIDKKFFSKIKKLKDVVICVTADHSTPCETRAHSSDPVPVLIYNGKEKDSVKEFSEKSCKGGSLGVFEGKDLMDKIKNYSK